MDGPTLPHLVTPSCILKQDLTLWPPATTSSLTSKAKAPPPGPDDDEDCLKKPNMLVTDKKGAGHKTLVRATLLDSVTGCDAGHRSWSTVTTGHSWSQKEDGWSRSQWGALCPCRALARGLIYHRQGLEAGGFCASPRSPRLVTGVDHSPCY